MRKFSDRECRVAIARWDIDIAKRDRCHYWRRPIRKRQFTFVVQVLKFQKLTHGSNGASPDAAQQPQSKINLNGSSILIAICCICGNCSVQTPSVYARNRHDTWKAVAAHLFHFTLHCVCSFLAVNWTPVHSFSSRTHSLRCIWYTTAISKQLSTACTMHEHKEHASDDFVTKAVPQAPSVPGEFCFCLHKDCNRSRVVGN